MEILSHYFNQFLLVLFLAFAAFLGAQAKNIYKKYVTTEIKEAVCRTAVRFVEQVYRDIHGEEKLRAAMEKASSLLQGYGIVITEEELVAMLEAAVNEFNEYFFKAPAGADKPPDED